MRFVAGEQELWLQHADQYSKAQELIQQLLQTIEKPDVAGSVVDQDASFTTPRASNAKPTKAMFFWAQVNIWFRSLPFTLTALLVTLLVALFSQLGTQLGAVAWLSFFPFVLDTQVYLINGCEHLWQQPWRLISPVFLHFGWLHLVFNLLWWLDLAARIERQFGLLLVTLLLATNLAGNLAQAF